MTATGDRRTHARHHRACCPLAYSYGGPDMAPKPPFARRAAAEPWRASITVAGDGGPDMAPKPPFARRAAAEPWRASITVAGEGAPTWLPNPPSLVAPRRSRGAPRSRSQVMGAPTW